MSFDALKSRQTELIRKALDGSFFMDLDGTSTGHIDTITVDTAGVVDLSPLPVGYKDVGWVNADGFQFGRETNTANITSFGSVTPTRSDVQSDVTSLTVNAQETNLTTLAMSTGAATSGISADAVTGEVVLTKPGRPSARSYKGLFVAVDEVTEGPIYMGRYFCNLKVTGYGTETYQSSAEEAILRTVTLGANPGPEGWSERWFFGGTGWKALLTKMGIPTTP